MLRAGLASGTQSLPVAFHPKCCKLTALFPETVALDQMTGALFKRRIIRCSTALQHQISSVLVLQASHGNNTKGLARMFCCVLLSLFIYCFPVSFVCACMFFSSFFFLVLHSVVLTWFIFFACLP